MLAIKVYIITCFFSFGVQTLCYLYYRLVKHPHIKKHLHVFNYASGIVGDGILVPMINVFGYFQMTKITNLNLDLYTLLICFTGGIIITDIFHHGQQKFELINWTMPETGNWNKLGLYHALFMFFESSFLCLVLFSYLKYIVFDQGITLNNSPIIYAVIFLGLFFFTFVSDYWLSLFKKFYSQLKISF